MKLSDLITSKDGSLSLTKLAASTFHLLLALAVGVHFVVHGYTFEIPVWTLYASFAVGHAAFDKSAAMVSAYKSKQLETPK